MKVYVFWNTIKTAVKYWRPAVKLSKRKLKIYNKKSSFSTELVIFARDTALIQLFLLSFLILKLLWGIRIKRIKMMSIERLSLDNRLKLAFIFSRETFWDYVMQDLFFCFLRNGWLKSANNLDKTQLSQT